MYKIINKISIINVINYIFLYLLSFSNISYAGLELIKEASFFRKINTYIDYDTLIPNGNTFSIMHIFEYTDKDQKYEGRKMKYAAEFAQYDCSSNRVKIIKINYYSDEVSADKIIGTWSDPFKGNIQNVDNDKIYKEVYKNGCIKLKLVEENNKIIKIQEGKQKENEKRLAEQAVLEKRNVAIEKRKIEDEKERQRLAQVEKEIKAKQAQIEKENHMKKQEEQRKRLAIEDETRKQQEIQSKKMEEDQLKKQKDKEKRDQINNL